ncbi:MOSC N-terminal beta barrel domain-containing protein [Streptomyces netropsis]|uniref:Molybdenum cofactor sulfurase middle domain-containing protein n=1 Tax=Streptomyces netropsis TaxID=55404 RepID=A0A7W7PGG5_STRNE|nr:MOSC N-terminal beta barrel domain-containing protein [Streptomyces netropsis]MBB4889054.1 hypothetical protein [Streptomyces netropsis]GGR08223.1 hypothetical protein GCM10010219_10700 [Streptomyces netropsis]
MEGTDMGAMLGTIERIWRYPIKSTGGELLDEAAVDARGLVGDRLYAVRDAEGKSGSGKNTRRFRRMPGLLHLRSRYRGKTVTELPELLDPDGAPVPDPTAYVRRYLDRNDVEVAREGTGSHFDQLPLSLLTTATPDWVRAAVPACPSTSAGSGRTCWCGHRRARLPSWMTSGWMRRPRSRTRGGYDSGTPSN